MTIMNRSIGVDMMSLTVAKCLMLLSQADSSNQNQNQNQNQNKNHHHHHLLPSCYQVDVDVSSSSGRDSSRVFECKTCNRQFPSFQALGGHRASHKKPARTTLLASSGSGQVSSPPPAAKPKTHECSVCGLEFAIGQALGGHMRRHRGARTTTTTTTTTSSADADDHDDDHDLNHQPRPLKKLRLDLNLTPFENDVNMFHLPKPSPHPLLHCFY